MGWDEGHRVQEWSALKEQLAAGSPWYHQDLLSVYVLLGVPLWCPPRQAHSPEELQVPLPACIAAQREGLSRSPGIESLDELGHWLIPERIATMRGKEHTD